MLEHKHPKALYLLFFTEMWERFSYYGMRGLLVIYCMSEVAKGGLGWQASDAGQLYGIYTGLFYFTPLFGGYLADRYLGQQKSIIIGGTFIALGHLLLAFNPIPVFFMGLGLLIMGNGFFKPNISSLVGQLYPDGSPLKDSAYTIFYMGINTGAFFGVLICGYLGEKIGWHYGFGAAGVGMTLGLIVFILLKGMLGEVGKLKEKLIVNNGVVQKTKLTSIERDRLIVIFALSFFSIVFWMAFEQAGSSMSIFALNYTNRNLGFMDFIVPASWFNSLNPFFIISFAPIISMLWVFLASKKKNPSNPLKFAIGLLLLGLGFLVLVFGSLSISANAKTTSISMFYLIFAYFLHTLGELCLSPIGLSSVNKLSPARFFSLMFGVWFFGTAVGNYISGALGGLIEEISKESSMAGFFLITTCFVFGASALAFLLSGKLKRMMHGVE